MVQLRGRVALGDDAAEHEAAAREHLHLHRAQVLAHILLQRPVPSRAAAAGTASKHAVVHLPMVQSRKLSSGSPTAQLRDSSIPHPVLLLDPSCHTARRGVQLKQ